MNLIDATIQALMNEARNPENDEINTKIRKSLNGSTKHIDDLRDAGLEVEVGESGKVSRVAGKTRGVDKEFIKKAHPDVDYKNYMDTEKVEPTVTDTGAFEPMNIFRNSDNFEKTISGQDRTYLQTDRNGVSKAIPKRYKTGRKNYNIDLDAVPRKSYQGVASYEEISNKELNDFKNNKDRLQYRQDDLDKAKAEYDKAQADYDEVNDKLNATRNKMAKYRKEESKILSEDANNDYNKAVELLSIVFDVNSSDETRADAKQSLLNLINANSIADTKSNFDRTIVLGNEKFRFRQEYEGFGIYQEVVPSGYAVSQSYLITNNAITLISPSYASNEKEDMMDIIDNYNKNGRFNVTGFLKADNIYLVHPSGELI